MKRLTIKDACEFEREAEEAVGCLNNGGLVVFPTETVYGIAAIASDKGAFKRLRKLKSRPRSPFSIHIHRREEIGKYVHQLPLRGRWLVERGLPGPLTILAETGDGFPDDELNSIPGLYESLTSEGIVGLRCPDQVFARRMLSGAGGPVVAPSANFAGRASPRDVDEIPPELAESVDMVIDAGPSEYGTDSTVVKISTGKTEIIRQGVYDEGMISRMMRRKLCFVCTGNTCRSPIAAGLAADIIAGELGCSVSDLESNGVEIVSAGTAAMEGMSATPEAVKAAGAMGHDISAHKTRRCTSDLIKSCDLVLCMSNRHASQVQQLAEGSGAEIRVLDENCGIADPIGSDIEVYISIASRMKDLLAELWKE